MNPLPGRGAPAVLALGAVLVAGCSRLLPTFLPTFVSPSVMPDVGCTLEAYVGPLMADGSVVRFSGGRWGSNELTNVRVVWPAGWTTRGAADGQVEVLNASGSVAARTGTTVRLSAASVTGSAEMQGDAVVACPQPFAIEPSERPSG